MVPECVVGIQGSVNVIVNSPLVQLALKLCVTFPEVNALVVEKAHMPFAQTVFVWNYR
jgi:hypothetical protein